MHQSESVWEHALNPFGSTLGTARDVFGNYQVGSVSINGITRASFWEGSAESWVDLNQFLPAGTTFSEATGVSSDGVNIYITGYAFINGQSEAFLWSNPVPAPGAAGVLLGLAACVGGRRRRNG